MGVALKMINDIIIKLLLVLDGLYDSLGLFDLVSDLFDKISVYENYTNDIQYYLSGAYFIFGKPLIIFLVSVGATIFVIKLVGAIVMIVGQFIP